MAAAPATGSTTWRIFTVETAAIALFLLVLAVLHGDMIVWAAQSIVATPVLVLAATGLFLLPGLALLRVFWPHPLDAAERWALAAGLSAIAAPLLTLAGSLAGLRWNGLLCWLVLLVCGIIAFWPRPGTVFDERQKRRLPSFVVRRSFYQNNVPGEQTPVPDYYLVSLVCITVVALLVRLFVVRDLPGGMFGDSYHHTMIAQLIVDNGGLFRSWLPYAPLNTFTYHYGFHSTVAWLSMLSGVPVELTLLHVGQIENALVVPLVFVFTKRLTGSARAALWAGALAAFASVLPAYYVNWGRYTQLAGQTILPAVCVVWMALLDGTNDQRPTTNNRDAGFRLVRLGALAALATAGLIVTHYRVAVFAGGFVAAYGLYRFVAPPRSLARILRLAGVGGVAGIAAVVLALPWLLRIREGALLRVADNFVAQNIGASETNALPGFGELIGFYLGRIIVALALIGLITLFVRRDWRGLVLPLWAALVLLAANPYVIGLSGAGILTNFAVLIAAYLILAPLAGIGVDALLVLAVRVPNLRPALPVVALAGLLALMVYGLNWQRNILDPGKQILTRADADAAKWIARELPADANIFVNSFPAYGGDVVVGSDGGWWLPLLARHHTNLPPVTYASEATRPGFMTAVRDQNQAFRATTLAAPDAPARLRAAGYTYLYDGPTAINLPAGTTELITPQALDGVAGYEIVYHSGGVTIWKVR